MNKAANKRFQDSTISAITSSYAYKDPYNPAGGIVYKGTSKVKSFVSMRMMENEFVDFRSYRVLD
jgi:hypothetical protein